LGVFDAQSFGQHEEIVFGSDPRSGLKTIIAIHSTALGPALGGTRFFPYDTEDDALDDVLRLAKGMSLKAAAAGLDLGGGKAVIIGDSREDKSERLWRAYGRIVDSLQGRYITAEDVGTTYHDMEMIRRETRWVVGIPEAEGGSGDPSPATARGLMRAMQAVSGFLWDNSDFGGRRVAVQGVGKVGSDLVRRLIEAGVEVVATDVYRPSLDAVVEQYGVKAVEPDEIYDVECDFFSPCSLGASLTPQTIPRLRCQAIVGSANNQLLTDADADLLEERGILWGPDFVVNAGGLINVHEEMRGYEVKRAAHAIDKIYLNTLRILEAARQRGVTTHRAAVDIAEERIDEIGHLRLFRRSGDDRN
jgi:leucine dehydrogenase